MLGKLKKRRRLRKHGFMKRKAQGGGILTSRRNKKRAQLTVSIHSK